MDTAPTTEAVYQGVYAFYNNTNAAEQEKASKWLEQLQNSVSTFYCFASNVGPLCIDGQSVRNLTFRFNWIII